ncbi:TPA: DUF373 family protein [Candidatus Micrarchaeota archaeon]|nr:DUF373 family protein [Candidatus Micrarchaeota archaeon]
MAEAKRLLVLCVDIDNDLGEKAKVRGPVVGRKANLEAASALGVADPEDSDCNTIFAAVKLFDDLSKEFKHVEVATMTGDARLGYRAHTAIVKQLEKLIHDFSPDACVFVSDGAQDEEVLPLVNARVKVQSLKTVTVKQSKALESTYLLVLEKLKEPQIARMVFGIPALALLLFAFAEFLGIRLLLGILGAYLLIKAIGLEEMLFRSVSDFKVSFENVSFIFYFASVPFFIASLWMAFSRVFSLQYQYSPGDITTAKIAAWFMKDFLLLLPVAVLLILLGKVLQALSEKKNHLLPEYLVQTAGVFMFWLIFSNAAEWVIGTVSFANFFYALILSVIAMYLVVFLAREFKHDLIGKMDLEGKKVYTEIGGFVGSIVAVNKHKETIAVKTPAGQKIDFSVANIVSLGEMVVIKY